MWCTQKKSAIFGQVVQADNISLSKKYLQISLLCIFVKNISRKVFRVERHQETSLLYLQQAVEIDDRLKKRRKKCCKFFWPQESSL
jgi:hypothetical protein